jgi:uncharacterized membrane protein HdeD (DUF308 family)
MLAIDLYVGWMFLISGLIGLFTMFVASDAAAFLWSLATAALSLFVGVLLLWHPVEGAVSLTLVLISFLIAEGIFQIAAAIRSREAFPESWGWLLMSGLADLVLVAMLIWGWPSTTTWTLGLIAGLSLSYRVATRRHCLILLKNRSIKFRARYRSGLKQIGSLRFRFGGMFAHAPC